MQLITTNKDYIPKKGTEQATCYDLTTTEKITIYPRKIQLIPTGVKTNFASKIYARSSLAIKKSLLLANSVGIIDGDYRGEIKVALLNYGDNPVTLNKGDRVAQMECKDFEVIVDEELYNTWEEQTERGNSGFGSTGGYKN